MMRPASSATSGAPARACCGITMGRSPLRAFRVVITLADQSQGEHIGMYTDSFSAVEFAQDYFPGAVKIRAEPLRRGRGAR